MGKPEGRNVRHVAWLLLGLALGAHTPAALADNPAAIDLADRFAVDAERARQAAADKAARERAQRLEAQRRAEEADMLARARREAEARRRQEAEQARINADRRAEEIRRQAEAEARRREAERTAVEARRRQEVEQARIEAERRAMEIRRQAEAEARRLEAERKAAEAKRQAEAEIRRQDAVRQHEVEADRITKALARAREQQALRRQQRAREQQQAREEQQRREREQAGPVTLPWAAPQPERPSALGGPVGSPPPAREPLAGADGVYAVLLVMAPGDRGIRRHNKTADPVLCVEAGCYVSTGAQSPADLLSRHRALGFGRTWGPRAGACRNSLGCVFRGVAVGEDGAVVQPVDMRVLRHDRRQPIGISGSSDCHVEAGELRCRKPYRGPGYVMWLVPEHMAARLGPALLEAAVDKGLPEAEREPGWTAFRQ